MEMSLLKWDVGTTGLRLYVNDVDSEPKNESTYTHQQQKLENLFKSPFNIRYCFLKTGGWSWWFIEIKYKRSKINRKALTFCQKSIPVTEQANINVSWNLRNQKYSIWNIGCASEVGSFPCLGIMGCPVELIDLFQCILLSIPSVGMWDSYGLQVAQGGFWARLCVSFPDTDQTFSLKTEYRLR